MPAPIAMDLQRRIGRAVEGDSIGHRFAARPPGAHPARSNLTTSLGKNSNGTFEEYHSGNDTPRQAAADGGFARRDNLAEAKARGVQDMAFHKKGGLRIEDMVRSRWVCRRLRNFRAGIEAGISCLKRAYGLARCTWRGLEHFRAYVWSAVVACNLALFARLRPA